MSGGHCTAELAAELAGVADYIDHALDDEYVDRQIVAEVASERIRSVAQRMAAGTPRLDGSVPADVSPDPFEQHSFGRNAAAGPRGVLVLSDSNEAVLGQALADAIAYRDPSGACPLCDEHPAGLCEDHADDLDKTDAYLTLARELGVEMEQ